MHHSLPVPASMVGWSIKSGQIAILTIVLSVTALAQYSIPSNISSTVTLDETSTYYRVPPGQTINIQSGGTLIIKPGVRIKLGQDAGFHVRGRMEAKGSPGNKVEFVRESGSGWNRIALEYAQGKSVFDHVLIEGSGAQYALRATESDFDVMNSEFRNNGGGSIKALGSSTAARVLNSLFRNNRGQQVSGTNVNNMEVGANTFIGQLGSAPDDVIDFENANGGRIYDNFVGSAVDEVFDIDDSKNVRIENNIFFGGGAAQHIATIKNSEGISINGNVFGNSPKGVHLWGGGYSTFAHNTFHRVPGAISTADGATAEVINTVFNRGSGLGSGITVRYSIAEDRNLNRNGIQSNIYADARMVDPDGENYELRPDSPARGAGTDNSDMGAFAANNLPVELIDFFGRADGSSVKLGWITGTETDNSGFSILSSFGGSEFAEVGWIPGAGTTDTEKVYEFEVNELIPGAHRFRFAQVDFDGTTAYSPIVDVKIDVPDEAVLASAYPNPFNPTTTLSFAVAETQPVTVSLHDALGRELKTLYNNEPRSGQSVVVHIDGGDLPSGVYLIRMTGPGFRALTRQVMLVK